MPGFDIRTLSGFKPPEVLCRKCLALFANPNELITDEPPRRARCPVCEVAYKPSEHPDFGYTTVWEIAVYLKNNGLGVSFADPLAHAQELGQLAILLQVGRRRRQYPEPPLRVLSLALARGRCFVHFTTWGLDLVMAGMLKQAAVSTHVRGVASNLNPNVRVELTEFSSETPSLDVRSFGARAGWQEPHQKLIVVDGLIAFTGSANLTTNSWRKIEERKEIVNVVTDIDEVRQLHNDYFSPIWADLSDVASSITMVDDIAF
jgi:hypothetical protein